MKKRLTGGAIIAASLFLAFQSSQNSTVNHTEQPNQVSGLDAGIVEQKAKLQVTSAAIPEEQMPVTLVETVDGDTIKVKLNGKVETIRYLLIDTPESKKPGMCIQPYALAASSRNNQLLQNSHIMIEFEPGNLRDNYGRLLAYVFADGQSVQETLLKEGFARVVYILKPPYKYLSLFKNNENAARKNKLNIWRREDYVTNRGFIGCEKGY